MDKKKVQAVIVNGRTVADVTTWTGAGAKQIRRAAKAARQAAAVPENRLNGQYEKWLSDNAARIAAWQMVESNQRKLPGGNSSWHFLDSQQTLLYQVHQQPNTDKWSRLSYPWQQYSTAAVTTWGCLEFRPVDPAQQVVHVRADVSLGYDDPVPPQDHTQEVTDVGYGPCPAHPLHDQGNYLYPRQAWRQPSHTG